ncbi:hypothetical protein [Streptomyces sp. NPDC057694]|uniref:hypothetical protein n=1 Tax=Streptomyces sp. NPDC057694 TaxID=3346216 RepID=UPI003685CB8E
MEHDLARCYAHTPTGALIAAVQISSRSMTADNWQDVFERQTYGVDRASTLKQLKDQFGEAPLPAPEPGELGQVAGFRYVTYNPQTAVVEVLYRYPDGSHQFQPMTTRWHGGDWQIEINNNVKRRDASSTEEFVTWGGV